MHLNNFHQNIKLIEKGNQWEWSYFLIETDVKLKSNKREYHEIFEMDDIDFKNFETNGKDHLLYPLNQNISRSIDSNQLKKIIMGYKATSNIFLFRIKICSMGSLRGISPDAITVISPHNICNHLLLILSLTYRYHFFRKINIILSLKCEFSNLSSISLPEKRLDAILSWISSVSEQQFLLIMDSVKFFNLAKIMSYTDVCYAYSMLCSSIETFSQTFPIPKQFQNHPLKNILEKELKNVEVSPKKINEIIKSFGTEFEKGYMYQTTKNFIHWCMDAIEMGHIEHLPIIMTDITKKMVKDMVKLWYSFRSKIAHGHLMESHIVKRNARITKTEYTDGGNIRKVKSLVNQSVDIPKNNEILPFNDMLNFVAVIIEITIQKLIENKENKEYMEKLGHRSLFQIGESQKVILKKPTKAGRLIRIGKDTYKNYTFTDHWANMHLSDQLFEKIEKKQFEEALLLFSKVSNIAEMIDDNLFAQFRIWLNVCVEATKNYQVTIDFINNCELNLKSRRYHLLNDKALYLGKLKHFEKAHDLIDNLIKKDEKENKENLILYFDTKGDIYYEAKKNTLALKWWKKSLKRGKSGYSKQTKEKIKQVKDFPKR
jgi:hypothetical protein